MPAILQERLHPYRAYIGVLVAAESALQSKGTLYRLKIIMSMRLDRALFGGN